MALALDCSVGGLVSLPTIRLTGTWAWEFEVDVPNTTNQRVINFNESDFRYLKADSGLWELRNGSAGLPTVTSSTPVVVSARTVIRVEATDSLVSWSIDGGALEEVGPQTNYFELGDINFKNLFTGKVYRNQVWQNGVLTHSFIKSSTSGNPDIEYTETVSGAHGQLSGFPANNDHWIYYDDGSSPEPVSQPVSLITAENKQEALTLPISEALSVNLLTGEHVTNGYVLNLVSSQVGSATISEERHQASMLTVEQTASQSVISIAAEHLSEAQILTPIQHQRLNSIVAQQVEQALSASLSSIQALTFVVAEEIQNATPLTVEQYTGQLITLIVAEQREGAQTLLVSQVNKLDLVTAEQASDAQALSIKDLQKIKTIEVEQLTETEILHVLLSGDNTDLTGLRLQPVTPIYSITPIANSYSLNKV